MEISLFLEDNAKPLFSLIIGDNIILVFWEIFIYQFFLLSKIAENPFSPKVKKLGLISFKNLIIIAVTPKKCPGLSIPQSLLKSGSVFIGSLILSESSKKLLSGKKTKSTPLFL